MDWAFCASLHVANGAFSSGSRSGRRIKVLVKKVTIGSPNFSHTLELETQLTLFMKKLPRRPNSWMLFKSLEPRNLRSPKKARRIHYLLNKFTLLEKGTMVPRMFQRKHKKVTYPLGSQSLTSISAVFACLSSVTNIIVSQAS